MINGIQLKVCGITSADDAEAAVSVGADYLGFIFYPNSPRYITATRYQDMKSLLPPVKKVAVLVEPYPVDLAALGVMGFDFFQIHFKPGTTAAMVNAWSETAKPAQLWLVPQLPPAADVPVELVVLADTFLLDTYHASKFGGTGETGDWNKFQRHQAIYPGKNWILSGGLKPENVVEALRVTGAKFIDVNSGVESAPGVKELTRLQALATALRSRKM